MLNINASPWAEGAQIPLNMRNISCTFLLSLNELPFPMLIQNEGKRTFHLPPGKDVCGGPSMFLSARKSVNRTCAGASHESQAEIQQVSGARMMFLHPSSSL